jgi:hypothetical protein
VQNLSLSARRNKCKSLGAKAGYESQPRLSGKARACYKNEPHMPGSAAYFSPRGTRPARRWSGKADSAKRLTLSRDAATSGGGAANGASMSLFSPCYSTTYMPPEDVTGHKEWLVWEINLKLEERRDYQAKFPGAKVNNMTIARALDGLRKRNR